MPSDISTWYILSLCFDAESPIRFHEPLWYIQLSRYSQEQMKNKNSILEAIYDVIRSLAKHPVKNAVIRVHEHQVHELTSKFGVSVIQELSLQHFESKKEIPINALAEFLSLRLDDFPSDTLCCEEEPEDV